MLGCTDAEAGNYDADATSNDGSCWYYGDSCDLPLDASINSSDSGAFAAGDVIWYSLAVGPEGLATLNVSSCGSSFDTKLMVISDCANAGCNPGYPDYCTDYDGYNDDGCYGFGSGSSAASNISLSDLTEGTYLIKLSGYSATSSGDFVFSLSGGNYPGCMDDNAYNYDSGADHSDGSCAYIGDDLSLIHI